LLDSPYLTIYFTTLIQQLLPLKAIERFEAKPLANWHYARLVAGKCFQYFSLLQYIAASLYLCWHVAINGGHPADHLTFNPVLSIAMIRFRLLDARKASLVLLLGLFTLYIDYIYFFRSNYRQIK